MAALLSLPQSILQDVLSNWTTLHECAMLDSAVSGCTRVLVLRCFNLIEKHFTVDYSRLSWLVYEWVALRCIRLLQIECQSDELPASLKTDSVIRLYLEDREYISFIVNKCPCLKTLELFNCRLRMFDVEKLNSIRLHCLTSLSVSGVFLTVKMLAVLKKDIRSLVHLSVIDDNLPVNDWCRFIEANPKLQYLVLDSFVVLSFVIQSVLCCSNIRVVELHVLEKFNVKLIPRFLANCCGLERLSIDYAAEGSRLEWVSGASKKEFMRGDVCLSLELTNIDTYDAVLMLLAAGHLNSLSLRGLVTDFGLTEAILLSCCTLTHLCLDNIERLAGTEVCKILTQCTMLQEVKLSMWNRWTGGDLMNAFQNSVNILRLDLSYNLQLSTDTAIYVVRKCPKLVWFKVSDMIDVGAVQSLLGEGMKVEIDEHTY